MKLSLIIPVYNRPGEIDELLYSLMGQTDKDFEVVIVEDGSTITCMEVVEKYARALDIHYYSKENSGPGLSRNYGAERSTGDYVIFLDSDCAIPHRYIETVRRELSVSPADAFGGPDRASGEFSPIQKAVSYSMTSFFTTGGIRGGKRSLDKFFPRSFNMGLSRKVFDATGGFSDMRFGEDIDLSYRIISLGFTTRLFPDAYVWHKRRSSMGSFFRQVFFSGMARVNLSLRHPGTLRVVHLFPSLFTLGCVILLAATPWCLWAVTPVLFIALVWFIDSAVQNDSVKVGALSVATSFIQLTGYGIGFLYGLWGRLVRKKSEKSLNQTKFY